MLFTYVCESSLLSCEIAVATSTKQTTVIICDYTPNMYSYVNKNICKGEADRNLTRFLFDIEPHIREKLLLLNEKSC